MGSVHWKLLVLSTQQEPSAVPRTSKQEDEGQDVRLGRRPRCPRHNGLWRYLNGVYGMAAGSQEQPSGFLHSLPTPGGASLESSVYKMTEGPLALFLKHTHTERESCLLYTSDSADD